MKNNLFYSCLLVSLVLFLFSSCGLGSKTGNDAAVEEGYNFCASLLDAPSTAVFLAFHPYSEIIPVISKQTIETVTLNKDCYIGCYEIEAGNKFGGRERVHFLSSGIIIKCMQKVSLI